MNELDYNRVASSLLSWNARITGVSVSANGTTARARERLVFLRDIMKSYQGTKVAEERHVLEQSVRPEIRTLRGLLYPTPWAKAMDSIKGGWNSVVDWSDRFSVKVSDVLGSPGRPAKPSVLGIPGIELNAAMSERFYADRTIHTLNKTLWGLQLHMDMADRLDGSSFARGRKEPLAFLYDLKYNGDKMRFTLHMAHNPERYVHDLVRIEAAMIKAIAVPEGRIGWVNIKELDKTMSLVRWDDADKPLSLFHPANHIQDTGIAREMDLLYEDKPEGRRVYDLLILKHVAYTASEHLFPDVANVIKAAETKMVVDLDHGFHWNAGEINSLLNGRAASMLEIRDGALRRMWYQGSGVNENGYLQLGRLEDSDRFSIEASLQKLGFHRWVYDDMEEYTSVVQDLTDGKVRQVYFSYDGLDYERMVYADPVKHEVETDIDLTYSRGMYQRPPIEYLIRNDIHFPTDKKLYEMIESNYEGLVAAFKNEQVPENLLVPLRENMNALKPEFRLSHIEKVGDKDVTSELLFKKSGRSDMYYWNATEVSFDNGKIADYQKFSRDNDVPEKNLSIPSQRNMLVYGNAAYREHQDGRQQAQRWYYLDPKEFTIDNKNHKLRWVDGDKYDPEAIIHKYGVAEKDNPEYVKEAIQTMREGGFATGTFTVDGSPQQLPYSANPRFNRLNVFDHEMKPVQYTRLFPAQAQAATQKALQTQSQGQGEKAAVSQTQGQGEAKKSDKSQAKEKKSNKRQQGQ